MSDVVEGVEPSDDPLIGLEALEDSLIYKISEKVASGLLEGLIKNGETITEVEMVGAINQTLYGVSTLEAVDWSNKLSQLLNVSTKNSAWAAKMFSLKPYSFVDVGKDVFLTNVQGSAPASHSIAFPESVVFDATTLGFDFNTFGTLMGASAKYLTYAGDGMVRVQGSWFNDLKTFVSNCGYSVYEGVRPFASHVGAYGATPPTIPMYKTKLTTGGGSNTFVSAFDAQLKKELLPGMKWMILMYDYYGQDQTAKTYWKWAGGGLSESNFYVNWVFIPIVDDGTETIPCMFYNMTDKTLTTFTIPDSRYASHSFGMRYSAAALTRHTGATKYVMKDGLSRSATSIPEIGWKTNWNAIYSAFLPFLTCPLDDATYVIGKTVTTTKSYAFKGSKVDIQHMSLSVKEFYCKISKQWYSDYYSTGFGLFTPKASNIQANIIEKWNALEFDTVGVCLVGAAQGFSSSNLIENLPLYQEYARAREKACKTNDWYDKPYNSALKWGDVRTAIGKSPSRNAFFCLNGYSVAATGFDFKSAAMAGVVWTVTSQKNGAGLSVKDSLGYDAWLMTRTEGASVTVTSAPESLELLQQCLEEVVQGASGPDMTMLSRKAGLYDNEVSEAQSSRTELTSSKMVRSASTLRFKMNNDFFFNQEMLGNNGYPAFSYMRSPAREMMVNRCYAELDGVFGPLVRIINSFTDAIVIDKIIKKL